MTEQEIFAELRLFKAVTLSEDLPNNEQALKKGLKSRILVDSHTPNDLIDTIIDMYGMKSEQLNASFHKSFDTVKNTLTEILIAQQLVHYFTTYGLEELGLFNEDLVYVPKEKLDIPELDTDIPVTIIRNITESELAQKLQTLVSSGIALSKQTIKDIITLSDFLDDTKFDTINNRELKIALYDKYSILPSNNIEFLKYLVYRTTGLTMLIQNRETIRKIKNCDRRLAYNLLHEYTKRDGGWEKLAEIFLRYKNIFLAYKVNKDANGVNMYIPYGKLINSMMNKLCKLSKIYHKPMEQNILDNLFQIKTKKELNANKSLILNELEKITVFREIRILNGLRYRKNLHKGDSVVYKCRNGKVYATEYKHTISANQKAVREELYDLIYDDLVKRLTPKIKDKTFYIPDNVVYMAPASEKMFIGEIPEGSYIDIPRDNNMVVGVHWFNLDKFETEEKNRVDLDLKLLGLNESYGWNTSYVSSSGDIAYSGDIVNAPQPNGATEAFIISPNIKNKSYLVKLNNFTGNKATVPFKFFVSSAIDNKDYIVNPNEVAMIVNNKFDNDDVVKDADSYVSMTLTLGYISIGLDTIRIYFKNFEDVKKRISSIDNINKNIYNFTNVFGKVQLTLSQIILDCGGKCVNTPVIESYEKVVDNNEELYKKVVTPVDYDLTLSSLTKDTIIGILS